MWSCRRVIQEVMLEGGVEKNRVVVRRRGAVLVRLPITWQDRWVVVTETCDVTAHEGQLIIPAFSEGKEPKREKKEKKPTNISQRYYMCQVCTVFFFGELSSRQ